MSGIEPSKIVWIDPLTSSEALVHAAEIEAAILDSVKKQGIRTLTGYAVTEWTTKFTNMKQRIDTISFANAMMGEIVKISVGLILYGEERTVDIDFFKTVNDACLVYDGALVIDNLAAGPVTKYSSTYQTKWSHKLYDSREVGEKLAEILVPVFDPTCPSPVYQNDMDLLRFTKARKVIYKLPGYLNFILADMPRVPKSARALTDETITISNEQSGIFSITVDKDGIIKTLLYLGPRRIPVDNLLTLYNRNEKYFNRLVSRYKEGIISDFIDYFNEPWALALFHDRFEVFAEKLCDTITRNPVQEIQEILDRLKLKQEQAEKANTDEEYSKFDKIERRGKWDESVFQYLLQTGIFETYP